MSYFPDDMPKPEPAPHEAGFWDRCSQRKLSFQGCASCHALRHPPMPICHQCHSVAEEWTEAPDEATIYSFNVVRHASHPAVESRLPYMVAILEFAGLPGVRLISNVTDVEPGKVHIGMRVKLWWDDVGEGYVIPRYRPIESFAS